MLARFTTILARLTANDRLLDACGGGYGRTWQTESPEQQLRRALADGADPNVEVFHRTWQEQSGTRFDVRQWWGGRRNEPIFDSYIYENYWRTPLSCAVEKNGAKLIDLLLEAGANPWLPGNGASGSVRASFMDTIFHPLHGRLTLIGILNRHFEHIVDCYPQTPPSKRRSLESFREAASQSKEASRFLDRLISHLNGRDLEHSTVVRADPVARPRHRL